MCPSGRSSWKSERSKPPLKDLGQEDDALPLIEEVLASQEQAAEEMPGLEDPEREGTTPADSSEGEKKPEESSGDPQAACATEERRHHQRERLNQILLGLLDKIPGKNGNGRADVSGHRGEGITCPEWKVSQENNRLLSWPSVNSVLGTKLGEVGGAPPWRAARLRWEKEPWSPAVAAQTCNG